MGKALCVGVTSAALGCAGTPVRPEPPPEPCPPGAVEAMEKLGIRLGDEGTATFFFEGKHVQPTTVTEGVVNVRYALGLAEDLPQNSRLSGRLIFGERVYGRLTRARSPDGSVNIPVCLELWDRQGGRGLIDLGKRGPTTATVLSTVSVRAVREFK